MDRWDNPAFDPDYPVMKLEEFEPAVRKVFAAPRKTMFSQESVAS